MLARSALHEQWAGRVDASGTPIAWKLEQAQQRRAERQAQEQRAPISTPSRAAPRPGKWADGLELTAPGMVQAAPQECPASAAGSLPGIQVDARGVSVAEKRAQAQKRRAQPMAGERGAPASARPAQGPLILTFPAADMRSGDWAGAPGALVSSVQAHAWTAQLRGLEAPDARPAAPEELRFGNQVDAHHILLRALFPDFQPSCGTSFVICSVFPLALPVC